MSEFQTYYRVLRDQRHWDEAVINPELAARADGVLYLQSLPDLPIGEVIQLPAPYDVPLSGIACGNNRTIYTAITVEDGQILIAVCGCAEHDVITGPSDSGLQDDFKFPRGLLVAGDQLLVADSDNGRVLVLELPSMRKHAEWSSGLQEPVCLVADSHGRVYVLDNGHNTVLRFSADGEIDSGFNLAVTSPFCIAMDKEDRLYVSDADTILYFDVVGPQAIALGEITAPASRLSPRKPRALAVHDARLYAADAESGYIAVFDTSTQT